MAAHYSLTVVPRNQTENKKTTELRSTVELLIELLKEPRCVAELAKVGMPGALNEKLNASAEKQFQRPGEEIQFLVIHII